jgi:hypothetical protein
VTNEPFEKSSSEAVHREPAIQREREEEREKERERELSSEAVHREPAHTETERGRERKFLYAALSY